MNICKQMNICKMIMVDCREIISVTTEMLFFFVLRAGNIISGVAAFVSLSFF